MLRILAQKKKVIIIQLIIYLLFFIKKSECPKSRCDIIKNPMKKIEGALEKIFKNLDIKCKYLSCNKIVKLIDLDNHEMICQLPKCKNFDVCENHVKPVINFY